MNGHELAALRARISRLESERDALRAELTYERTSRARRRAMHPKACSLAARFIAALYAGELDDELDDVEHDEHDPPTDPEAIDVQEAWK